MDPPNSVIMAFIAEALANFVRLSHIEVDPVKAKIGL
jgi:hypothetical protein